MAVEQPGFTTSLVAGSSLASSQFLFGKLNSSAQVIPCAGATDKPVGIIQNDCASGGEATVMVEGISKLIAGGTIAVDDLIGTDSAGKGVAYVPGTDTTKYIVGRALEAASSGEAFTVLFSCMSIGGNRGA